MVPVAAEPVDFLAADKRPRRLELGQVELGRRKWCRYAQAEVLTLRVGPPPHMQRTRVGHAVLRYSFPFTQGIREVKLARAGNKA